MCIEPNITESQGKSCDTLPLARMRTQTANVNNVLAKCKWMQQANCIAWLMMSGAGWTDESTRALLSIWGQQNIQQQLDGVKRNTYIYDKISSELSDVSYEFTTKQCRTKVKNLIQSYRKVRYVRPVFVYYNNLLCLLNNYYSFGRRGITIVCQARDANNARILTNWMKS